MAKPQIKKVKKDSKGVTYYFSDDDGIMCVDIDVEPGVKSVVFQERQCASKWKSCYSRFLLRNVKKQFPDVERLIISGECIYTIDISNMMFPNIHCSAFKVTESNKQICAVDGVIYSKDKKILLAYPRHRCGDFVIPDGTEIIYDNAFAYSDITSVKIPDSVYRIKTDAFSNCEKLKRIGFNKTITDYSKYGDIGIFYGCQSLEPFTIPSHIETLGISMFFGCNTTEIRLQEGIKRLDANSIFLWTKDSLDDELIIPSTLQVIESRIIRPGQHKIRVKSRTPAGLVNAVTNTSSYTNNDGVAGPFVITLTIEEDGKEYVFYIPRFLSLETSKNLDNFFNMYSPSAMSEEYMDSLYEDTPCLYVKQDTALELYHLTGKQFYKDFLKKSKNSIIKRYFDRGQEKEIIDFLQFGFFASSSLDKFRKIADEREMSVLSAYILEEQKKKAPKTTTKFTI